MVTLGEKYVERVEKALIETIILNEARSMPVTIDNLWPTVRGMGFTEKVDQDFVKGCANRLKMDGHLKEENDRYVVTDDGREDVQKLEIVLRHVADRVGSSTRGPTTGTGAAGSTGTTGTVGTRR